MSDKQDEKSPAKLEDAKSKKQRVEDVAYTLNHSLVCTATDFIDPYVGNLIQKHLGNNSQLKDCWIAEFAGDFGAVPFTIAMQRMFPSFMRSLSQAAEPIVGKFFHNGAERAAQEWAKEHNLSVESPEYKKRVEKIYQYEMSHVPQALMWTVSSIAINVSMQRFLGNSAPISHIIAGKMGGAALTAGITTGGRGLFPRKAEKWDKFTSEKIFLPVQDLVNNTFGISGSEEKKDMYQKREEEKRSRNDRYIMGR